MIRILQSTTLPDGSIQGDYVRGVPEIRSLYTHAPTSLAAAVPAREGGPYPRAAVARALVAYNRALGAPAPALEAAASLEDPRALCVVTGQQAGLLGGPLYTLYKAATAIRIARELRASLGRPVVPILWLATEDHDFLEINHAHALTADGQTTRISFGWEGVGRPVADLVVGPEVVRAVERWFAAQGGSLEASDVAKILSPRVGEPFGTWVARMYHVVFGADGLVILEPRVLTPLAGDWFARVLENGARIREALQGSAEALRGAGRVVPLDPAQAGVPFRYADNGHRVRCRPGDDHTSEARSNPARFSPDAAIRPALQDTLLPTVVSVLGPGEFAYQSMLKPVYECLETRQPLLLPRLSATLLTPAEEELATRSGIPMEVLLAPVFRVREVLAGRVDPEMAGRLESIRGGLEDGIRGLAGKLPALDPNLATTAQHALDACLRALSKLEVKMGRAGLSRAGVGARSIAALRGALRPNGAPQERTFPLPFFLIRHGQAAPRGLQTLGDPLESRHIVGVA